MNSNLQEVETEYYCSNVRNIVNQDINLYNTLQENIDAESFPLDSVAALNFEHELFNMYEYLDEEMNCQQ